jgi:hypothetical protein
MLLPAAGAAIAGAETIFIELAGQRSTQPRHDVGFGRCGQHAAFERTEHVAHDAGRIENDIHQARRMAISPLRSLSNRFSVRWHSATSSAAFRNPAPPLMV